MYCKACPISCGADREKACGVCGESKDIRIAKYYLHPFEEPVLSAGNGSGTVFFCGCSLKCAFCQNFELSRSKRGKVITEAELADIFKELEDMGANNINLVSPTHFTPQIVKAFEIYKPSIPVCYNTHGYEKLENLTIIDPYVDVYLPDLKFFSPKRAQRYCGRENYFDVAIKAIEFMINSKPCIEFGGLLKQGVIVRHLILPQNLDETSKILEALRPIIKDAYLSLMAQYTPFGEIEKLPELKRKITRREYETAVDKMNALAYEKVFLQEFASQSTDFIPDWDF